MLGCLSAPGDKSISHRALILGALASGRTEITGLLESDDVLATARAIAGLGAGIDHIAPGHWVVSGTSGQFAQAATPLDLGNSGTGVRLLMGAIAGAGGQAMLTGDSSLTARPMARVIDPLKQMGADILSADGKLPVKMAPAALRAITYALPVASAQVKSALLLAALGAEGETRIVESRPTRDHTERMLPLFGGSVSVTAQDGDTHIALSGPQSLKGTAITIPGDPSSAAFATVAALLVPGSDITITGMMDNPARGGLYHVLARMGANITVKPAGHGAGESLIDMSVKTSALHGIDLEDEIVPSMIDEYPVLAVAAAFADGETRLRGLGELRAKESDRLAGTAALLMANGVKAVIEGDDLIIEGRSPASIPGGGTVHTHGDHRLAMSGLVMGLASRAPVTVDEATMIATSYPGFVADMLTLGAKVEAA